jgi:hypothetical protein
MDAVYARHKPDFHFYVFICGDRNFDSILLFKETLTFPFFLLVTQFAQNLLTSILSSSGRNFFDLL